MAPKFQIKVFQFSTFVKNFTIISIVTLSFLLVFFSKSDLYLINGIKNVSSSVIIPITKVISAPLNAFSNFVNEYNKFKSLNFEKVVISCGAWSNEIINNSFGIKFPTRPLKGISLTLKAPLIKFNHNLWFRNIYIAQRDNGILAVGATEEEKGFDNSVRMDELFFLTNSLWESLPKLEDISLNEIKVGLRPAVFDGNPIIGPLEEVSQDIICNFGHYRNGILLAPITSQIISQYILEENITKEYKFFSPKRFNL